MSNGENTGTTISTQVITASLAMISLIGAFAVFIIDKRGVGYGYYILTGISFLCFVTSIFLGGKGISGKGRDKTPNPYYDWQAKTALLGVILFCISVFLPRQKTDELEKKINDEHDSVVSLKEKTNELKNRIDSLEKLVYEIKFTKTAPNSGLGASGGRRNAASATGTPIGGSSSVTNKTKH